MQDGGTWLDEEVEPYVKGFHARPARVEEILKVFGDNMHHVAGLVDGQFVGLISFKRMDERLWAMLTIMSAPKDVWMRMAIVATLRKELKRMAEPLWVVEEGPQAEPLLKLVGLKPTGEMMGTRRVWSS